MSRRVTKTEVLERNKSIIEERAKKLETIPGFYAEGIFQEWKKEQSGRCYMWLKTKAGKNMFLEGRFLRQNHPEDTPVNDLKKGDCVVVTFKAMPRDKISDACVLYLTTVVKVDPTINREHPNDVVFHLTDIREAYDKSFTDLKGTVLCSSSEIEAGFRNYEVTIRAYPEQMIKYVKTMQVDTQYTFRVGFSRSCWLLDLAADNEVYCHENTEGSQIYYDFITLTDVLSRTYE